MMRFVYLIRLQLVLNKHRTQKKAREKRLMAYAEEIQKNTLQMSSALIAELVAERKYQKKTQQDIADITGILQKSGGKAHGFNRGMKAKKLFAIIGQ